MTTGDLLIIGGVFVLTADVLIRIIPPISNYHSRWKVRRLFKKNGLPPQLATDKGLDHFINRDFMRGELNVYSIEPGIYFGKDGYGQSHLVKVIPIVSIPEEISND